MGEIVQYDWSALGQLIPLCLEFKKQIACDDEIDLHAAAAQLGEAFGISDIDECAKNALGQALNEGLGIAFEEKDAQAIAGVFAAECGPCMKLIVEYARGNKSPAALISGLNETRLRDANALEAALRKSLGIPDGLADKMAERLGGYTVSVYCFTAAFKIYQSAARDAQLAKERRIEIEELTEKAIAHLKDQRAQMDRFLSDYLLDRLVPFSRGVSAMDQAIIDNDDDGFIAANAELWKVFGRSSQYATADEFDDLMLSDDVFIL